MFENQLDDYIVKALVEESQKDGEFLTANEIAYRVNGMMYNDGEKSNGPIGIRNIRNRMNAVRKILDEGSVILLPHIMEVEEGGEEHKEVAGWKIATSDDLDLIKTGFLGMKSEEDTNTESPEADDPVED
jgi:hypothetical protein